MKKFKILFALILIGFNVVSQTDSLKKLTYISFDIYLFPKTASEFYQSTAQQISKESNSLLIKDVTNYKNYYGNVRNISAGANVNLALRLIKKHPNQITRLSLGVNMQSLASSQYYNDTTRFLKYVPSNSPLYNSFSIVNVDSKTINYSYDVVCLSLSGAHLFYTKRERYVSVYTGISVAINSSLSAKVHSSYFEKEDAYSQDPFTGNTSYLASSNVTFSSPTTDSYSSKAKTAGIIGVGIPLGLELRCAKSKKRLKHLSFGFELMPQLNYVLTPKLSDQSYFTIKTTPFNLIYRF